MLSSTSNVYTTPITAMGCWQYQPPSIIQLKGKHCQKTHCRNGVVDTFGLTYFSSMTALRIAVVRPYLLATFLQLLPSVLFCFKGMRGFQSSAPLNHVSRLDVSRKTKKHTVWTIKCDTFSTSYSSFLWI